MASITGRMSVAIPHNIQKKLDLIATSEDRSRNWIVNQAINQYLDLHDWQAERISKRLEISKKESAVFCSSNGVDQMIEMFKL